MERPKFTTLLAGAVVGVYLLVVAGATAAIADAAAACSSWPLCPPDSPGAVVALGHRAAAALVGLLLVVTALVGWSSTHTRVRIALLIALVLLGVLAVAADLTAEVVSARAGGASLTTSLIAGGLGVILFALAGPAVALLAVVADVFLLEYRRHRDAARGARAAGVLVLGMLGSAVVQVLLTGSMLAAFVLGVLL